MLILIFNDNGNFYDDNQIYVSIFYWVISDGIYLFFDNIFFCVLSLTINRYSSYRRTKNETKSDRTIKVSSMIAGVWIFAFNSIGVEYFMFR